MKKRVFGKFTVFCTITAMLMSIAPSLTYAENDFDFIDEVVSESDYIYGEIIPTRAEVTGYVYIMVDDVEYKRLWSYTRGIWLSDWIKV